MSKEIKCPRCGSTHDANQTYCSRCRSNLLSEYSSSPVENREGIEESSDSQPQDPREGLAAHDYLDELDRRLRHLQDQIFDIEAKLPQSKIIHPDFWPRACAVAGHLLAISLLFWISLISLAGLFLRSL